jgi:hypothetical protein
VFDTKQAIIISKIDAANMCDLTSIHIAEYCFGAAFAGERRNFANEGRICTSITQAGMHSFYDGSPRRSDIFSSNLSIESTWVSLAVREEMR